MLPEQNEALSTMDDERFALVDLSEPTTWPWRYDHGTCGVPVRKAIAKNGGPPYDYRILYWSPNEPLTFWWHNSERPFPIEDLDDEWEPTRVWAFNWAGPDIS